MNCKPGDLAVVVWSVCGNEGKIVRCVELVMRYMLPSPLTGPGGEMLVWRIDQPLRGFHEGHEVFALDYQLRPIRDNDGDDETLAWAGKPEQVTA